MSKEYNEFEFCPIIKDKCKGEKCVWWDGSMGECQMTNLNLIKHSLDVIKKFSMKMTSIDSKMDDIIHKLYGR